MEKIVAFPDRELMEQQASEWLIRLDGDELLSPDELLALREWIKRSPAHRDELTSLAAFWSDQSLTALPIPIEQLCYENPTATDKPSWHDFFTAPQRHWGAIAVSGLLAMMVTLVATNTSLQSVLGFPHTDEGLYATAIGQQRTVTLADGSTIYLNTNSQIKVEYNQAYRNIELMQGEAHFDVAKQPQRPFRVYAGRGRVQAVGTAFTVFIRNNHAVDIAVTEGKVALASLDQGVISPAATTAPATVKQTATAGYYPTIPVEKHGLLEAGQAATLLLAAQAQTEGDQLSPIKSVTEQELERRGAWRSGLWVFTGDTLDDVVKEVSRYTTLSIAIVDPELKQLRIGGRFSLASTNELFNALEANFGLQIQQLSYNRVEISLAANSHNNSYTEKNTNKNTKP